MSLEDSPDPEPSVFELGDKVVQLPPDKANLLMHGPNIYLMNGGSRNMYYYVQVFDPVIRGQGADKPPTIEREGYTIVKFIPISRRDELAP